MLSQKTIDIVKSTAPILETHGVEITTYFYRTMFEAHPELLNIFNHANQSKGRQQTALANTVYAAAKYIDQLEVLLPAVKQIAHKHRSLAIKAEHYPIVGEYLLKAIKGVLGEAATDDIINAWAEAYGVIAQIFIDVEKEMYDQAELQEHGWKDFKEFVIQRKVKESSLITSFYLKAKDGEPVPAYLPGQYITIRTSIPGEEFLVNRQYSLSQAPGSHSFRISVKREADYNPEGKVSVYLHDQLQEGDTLEVSAPAGDFYLEQGTQPVALIAGGVGITPMMAMLGSIAQNEPDRKTVLIQAARNKEARAFEEEAAEQINRLSNGKMYVAYEEKKNESDVCDVTGYISKSFLQDVLDPKSICYVCGPVPFMQAVIRHLTELGFNEQNIKYEFFGPAMALQA
ncbi:NO-inducible flavohemoprotein [Domibacillus indicus]|uniref:NO-inducible flavohemoprotein n=1 Tax=Domibacillus indicus TaxID=1437523 RepID=UPI00203A403F|nr:NO-inducible flavohemoprotein [Domibacillus indicus]MCM3789095.1 NO-inducible flavohemoprotein [Domibacillus indicus]